MKDHSLKRFFEKKPKAIVALVGCMILIYTGTMVYATNKGNKQIEQYENALQNMNEKEGITDYIKNLDIAQNDTENRCGEILRMIEEKLQRKDYQGLYEYVNVEYLEKANYQLTYSGFREGILEEFDIKDDQILVLTGITEALSSGGVIVKCALLNENRLGNEISYDTINIQTKAITAYINDDGSLKGFLPFPEPLIERYVQQYDLKK